MKENNLKLETENKPEKKKLKKEDIIGFIFGISLAWSIGLSGLIPYIIGTFLGIWLARKMLNNKKVYVRVSFWIIFVAVFIFGSLFYGMKINSNYLYPDSKSKEANIKSLETDKSPNTSQISGNLYRNTKYNFRIKFPDGWKIEGGDGAHIVQKATFENSTISIMIQQLDLEGGTGFSSIKDAGTLKDFIDTVIKDTSKKFSNVKIINYGETKIDNEPAYWIEYSINSQILDHQLKMTKIEYCIAKGNTMYLVSAGTALDEYSNLRPIFIQSIETFVLEN